MSRFYVDTTLHGFKLSDRAHPLGLPFEADWRTPAKTLKELVVWLEHRTTDPHQWIADNLPELVNMAAEQAFGPEHGPPPLREAYKHWWMLDTIQKIRAARGAYEWIAKNLPELVKMAGDQAFPEPTSPPRRDTCEVTRPDGKKIQAVRAAFFQTDQRAELTLLESVECGEAVKIRHQSGQAYVIMEGVVTETCTDLTTGPGFAWTVSVKLTPPRTSAI
jgi:hypothetical protein